MKDSELKKMIEDDYPKHPEALLFAVIIGFILLIVAGVSLMMWVFNLIFG